MFIIKGVIIIKAETSKAATPVEKTFKCQQCGNDFTTTANHAKYCKDCARQRQFDRAKAYNEKKKNLQLRPLGSTDICPECGNEYLVKSGSQKVCENCRKKYTNKMKSKTNAVYSAKAYDVITVYLKKGEKSELKNKLEEYKQLSGEDISVNEFINEAIKKMLKELDSKIADLELPF